LTEELGLEVMLAAWPPHACERLGEWTLRFAGGFTRRANSVLPRGDPGCSLELAVERCEAAYAARGLPASFQLRQGHTAEGLEEVLVGRGYRPEYPALVLAGPLPQGVADRRVSHAAEPSAEWLETWLAVSRADDPAAAGFSRGILERVSRPRTFAVLREDRRVIATALGTLSPGWLGLSCLAVQEQARQRGVGRAMVGAVAAWARAGGAERVWLEVEDDNEPALALYRGSGLARIGGYSYLTRAPGLAP
jgi:ribosomal protein S18 acetylase RimI-like enzyme